MRARAYRDYDTKSCVIRWFEEHHPEQGNFTHESDRDAIRAVLAKQVCYYADDDDDDDAHADAHAHADDDDAHAHGVFVVIAVFAVFGDERQRKCRLYCTARRAALLWLVTRESEHVL